MIFGVLSFQRSLGYLWQGAISVLEALVVDPFSPPWVAATGNYNGDPRPSFPQNLRAVYLMKTQQRQKWPCLFRYHGKISVIGYIKTV
jgi:hypothetical protein